MVTDGPTGRLAALREEYSLGGLDESDLAADPFEMLGRWLGDAIAAGLHDPHAMAVATVGASGRPSSRIVLLKGLSAAGLVFYSNYGSRKGEDLSSRPVAAAVFPFHPLQRQARVEGSVTKVDPAESDAYFAGRPRASQLSAWASPQSQVVGSRAQLDARYDEVDAEFEGRPVPRPPYWGGYRIVPDLFEFWQGRQGRLHDRFRYRPEPTRPERPWVAERLAP